MSKSRQAPNDGAGGFLLDAGNGGSWQVCLILTEVGAMVGG
jgi:hypothetical protein